jgi:DNA-binding protein YbaB
MQPIDKEDVMTQPGKEPDWMERVFALRDGLATAASNMTTAEVTRSSGGVTVTLAASGELRSIRVDPKVLSSAAELERHTMRAHQEAHQAIRQMAEEMMGPVRDMVTQANQRFSAGG